MVVDPSPLQGSLNHVCSRYAGGNHGLNLEHRRARVGKGMDESSECTGVFFLPRKEPLPPASVTPRTQVKGMEGGPKVSIAEIFRRMVNFQDHGSVVALVQILLNPALNR
jgi:hypothetical protein